MTDSEYQERVAARRAFAKELAGKHSFAELAVARARLKTYFMSDPSLSASAIAEEELAKPGCDRWTKSSCAWTLADLRDGECSAMTGSGMKVVRFDFSSLEELDLKLSAMGY